MALYAFGGWDYCLFPWKSFNSLLRQAIWQWIERPAARRRRLRQLAQWVTEFWHFQTSRRHWHCRPCRLDWLEKNYAMGLNWASAYYDSHDTFAHGLPPNFLPSCFWLCPVTLWAGCCEEAPSQEWDREFREVLMKWWPLFPQSSICDGWARKVHQIPKLDTVDARCQLGFAHFLSDRRRAHTVASKTQMGVRLNMTLLYLIRRLVTGGNLTRCERCMASFDKMRFSLLRIQHV